jgi:hypothetical protein
MQLGLVLWRTTTTALRWADIQRPVSRNHQSISE